MYKHLKKLFKKLVKFTKQTYYKQLKKNYLKDNNQLITLTQVYCFLDKKSFFLHLWNEKDN